MTQGKCTTNKETDSVHQQPISLKEYLICIYYDKAVKGDDKAFQRASNHCLSQLKLKIVVKILFLKNIKLRQVRTLKPYGLLYSQS